MRPRHGLHHTRGDAHTSQHTRRSSTLRARDIDQALIRPCTRSAAGTCVQTGSAMSNVYNLEPATRGKVQPLALLAAHPDGASQPQFWARDGRRWCCTRRSVTWTSSCGPRRRPRCAGVRARGQPPLAGCVRACWTPCHPPHEGASVDQRGVGLPCDPRRRCATLCSCASRGTMTTPSSTASSPTTSRKEGTPQARAKVRCLAQLSLRGRHVPASASAVTPSRAGLVGPPSDECCLGTHTAGVVQAATRSTTACSRMSSTSASSSAAGDRRSAAASAAA